MLKGYLWLVIYRRCERKVTYFRESNGTEGLMLGHSFPMIKYVHFKFGIDWVRNNEVISLNQIKVGDFVYAYINW